MVRDMSTPETAYTVASRRKSSPAPYGNLRPGQVNCGYAYGNLRPRQVNCGYAYGNLRPLRLGEWVCWDDANLVNYWSETARSRST